MTAGRVRAPPHKRNEPPPKETADREYSAAGESGSLGGGTSGDSTAPATFMVIGIKSSGRRSILCAGICRDEAERWVASHKPFAVAAGGDVVIESEARSIRNELRVAG